MVRKTDNTIFTSNFMAVSLINLTMMSAYYMLMVTITSYSLNDLKATHSMAGLIAGSMVLGLLAGRFVSGKLLSVLSFRNLLFLGIAEYLVFMGCYLLAKTPEQLLVVRFLSGFGVGLVSTVTGTIVAYILPKDLMGTGISYYSLSTILATALGPFVGLLMMEHFPFTDMFLLCIGAGVLSVVMVFGVRVTLPQAFDSKGVGHDGKGNKNASDRKTTSDEKGASDENIAEYERVEDGTNAERAGEDAYAQAQKIGQKNTQKQGGQPKARLSLEDFIEYRAVPISIVVFLCGFGYSSIQAFIASYAEELDLVSAARLFFIVYAAVILISRPITGRIMDKKGPDVVIYPSLFLFALGLFLLSAVHSWWAFLLAGALVGAGFGNFQSTAQALAIKMVPEHRFGHATSTFFIFLDIAVGVGPFLLGFIVAYISYPALYISMSLLSLLCLAAYYFLQAHRPYYDEARGGEMAQGTGAEHEEKNAERGATNGSGGGASRSFAVSRGKLAHAKQDSAKTPR